MEIARKKAPTAERATKINDMYTAREKSGDSAHADYLARRNVMASRMLRRISICLLGVATVMNTGEQRRLFGRGNDRFEGKLVLASPFA